MTPIAMGDGRHHSPVFGAVLGIAVGTLVWAAILTPVWVYLIR
jgi:hypothetical protein